MKAFSKLLLLVMALFVIAGCSSETKSTSAAPAAQRAKLAYEVDDVKAPVVYWTKGTDADALVKAYEATGKKLEGKIALKISFETPNGPYLSPELLSKLKQQTNGTFGDSNGFSAPRNTTAGHLKLAEDHGFTKLGPVDILDSDGSIDIPVNGGKYLKYHRIGGHFANYDSVISIVKFKAHHIRDYGGTLKNLTICLADTSGKANIHSAGRVQNGYSPAQMDEFLESMADAAKAAVDYRKDKWVFINVINGFKPDDKCSDAKDEPVIGIIASTDPVAVDQAAVDFVYGTAPSQAVRDKWEQDHNVRLLKYAEERGVGQRHYQLKEI